MPFSNCFRRIFGLWVCIVPQAKRADDNKCEKILYVPAVSSVSQEFKAVVRLLDLQLMSDLVYVLFIALFVYSISNSHNDLSRNSSGKYLYDLSKIFGWGFFLRGIV